MTRLISNINDNRIRYVVPVEISSSLSITGSLLTTAGITGSIQGTASVALTAITAQTASFLTTANNYQANSIGVGTSPLSPFKINSNGQVIIQNGINNATGQQSLIFAYPGITNSLTHSIYSGHDTSVANFNKLDFYISKISGQGQVNVLSLRSSRPVLIGSDTGLGLDVSGSTTITGSLNVTSGVTGSLLGTASFATQASSASYVSNLQQDVQITGSLSTKGTFSVGRITTSNAVIQRAQSPAGSYSFIFAGGAGLVDTFPYTQLDTHGATIDMRAGDPASDQYAGGILITANGNTSPLGEGNAIVFKNRTGTNTYTERMRITHDGNVGINISPAAKLHVDGTIRIDNQNGSTPTGPNASAGNVNQYWGTADGVFLSTPNTWLKISLGGADYYFPAYT